MTDAEFEAFDRAEDARLTKKYPLTKKCSGCARCRECLLIVHEGKNHNHAPTCSKRDLKEAV